MENIKLIYHDKEHIILINYFNNNVINLSNNLKGKFKLEDDNLEINWLISDIDEFFKKDNQENNFLDMTIYNFIDKNNDKSTYNTEEERNNILDNSNIIKKYFIHTNWSTDIYLDFKNYYFTKNNNDDNIEGIFEFDNNGNIILFWYEYEKEIFSLNNDNNNYYLIEYDSLNSEILEKINNEDNQNEFNELELELGLEYEYILVNENSEDLCILNNKTNIIFKKYFEKDKGQFLIENDKIIVFWQNFDNDFDIFYLKDNKYIIDKNQIIILEDEKNNYLEYNIIENYFIEKENQQNKINFLYCNNCYYIIKNNTLVKYNFYKNNGIKKIYKNENINNEDNIFNEENINQNNLLIIINLNNENDLENILKNISKESHIIVNIINEQIENSKYFIYLFSLFKNLTITKYKNKNSLFILDSIKTDLLNINYNNLLYINKYYDNLITYINKFSEEKTEYNSLYILKENTFKVSYLFFNKINVINKNYQYYSYFDLCLYIIFYYFINQATFSYLENNFMINNFFLDYILDYDLTKKYYIKNILNE